MGEEGASDSGEDSESTDNATMAGPDGLDGRAAAYRMVKTTPHGGLT